MKFIVSSTSLFSHLQAISRVINSKNSLPILDSFLFHLEGEKLTITASDAATHFNEIALILIISLYELV